MRKLNFKKILLTAMLAVSMLNVSAFLGRSKFPIHKAASNFNKLAFNEAIVDYLLKDRDCKVSKLINMKDDNGRTPLHVALSVKLKKSNYKESISFIKELIFKEKVDVNIQDNNGDTPLHYIMDSLYTKKALFAYLIMAGARVDIKNIKGQTVWDKYFNCEEAHKLFYEPYSHRFEAIWMLMVVDIENMDNYRNYIDEQPNKNLKKDFNDFNIDNANRFLSYALEEVNKFVLDDGEKITVEVFYSARN